MIYNLLLKLLLKLGEITVFSAVCQINEKLIQKEEFLNLLGI